MAKKRVKKQVAQLPTVKLRNGEVLKIGDECTTGFHRTCIGKTFVICEMNPYGACESGMLIVAHLKEDPERKITGLQETKAGWKFDGPPGIDAGWFKKIQV